MPSKILNIFSFSIKYLIKHTEMNLTIKIEKSKTFIKNSILKLVDL